MSLSKEEEVMEWWDHRGRGENLVLQDKLDQQDKQDLLDQQDQQDLLDQPVQ
jgi:hypothetical protein